MFGIVAAKRTGLKRKEIWRLAANGDIGVELAEKHSTCKNKPSVLCAITNTVADDFPAEPGRDLWRKITHLVRVRHHDVFRIFGLNHLLPCVSVSVRCVGAELFVFGNNNFFQVIAGKLRCKRAIFVAWNDGRYAQAQVLGDALRGGDRFERSLIQNAVLMFDKNENITHIWCKFAG